MATARPTKKFREQFARLPADVQDAVEDVILEIEASPREAGIPLRGRWRGYWKRRVGLYRILYRILEPRDENVVLDSLLYRPNEYPRFPARSPR